MRALYKDPNGDNVLSKIGKHQNSRNGTQLNFTS